MSVHENGLFVKALISPSAPPCTSRFRAFACALEKIHDGPEAAEVAHVLNDFQLAFSQCSIRGARRMSMISFLPWRVLSCFSASFFMLLMKTVNDVAARHKRMATGSNSVQ